MRGPLRPFLPVLAAGLLAAAVSQGGSAAFRSPAAGARVESGQTIAVEWDLPAVSAPGFEESELLLSLDGGATFPLRVTRQIAPRTHRVAWRVPRFPTRHARLGFRTGSDGLADSEVLSLMSEEFVIEPAPGAPLEDTFFVAGEWRTRDALERPDAAPPDTSSLGTTQEDRVVPATAQSAVAESRPDPMLARLASPLLLAPERPRSASTLSTSPPRPRREAPLNRRE